MNSGVGWVTRPKLLVEKLVPKRMFRNYTGARVRVRMSYTSGTRKEGKGQGGRTVCAGLSLPSEGLCTWC